MKTAFLSGLGVMGRRHLVGLARSGLSIEAFDPSQAAREAAVGNLASAGLDASCVSFLESYQKRSYDVAVFSEPADLRLKNLEAFLRLAEAGRFLLEKPISADPAEVERVSAIFADRQISLDRVAVNMARRVWPNSAAIMKLAHGSSRISMSVNGGAFGLGGNGIHHIDLFLYLTDYAATEVRYSTLFPEPIASGRGAGFRDFGGEFVLGNARGTLHIVCLPTSSAAAMLTVVGDDFSGTLDERTLHWQLVRRDAASTAPPYRCGFEYRVEADGPAEIVPMDVGTGLWALQTVELPTLSQSLVAHRLLHQLLAKGGAQPPYQYT